MSGGDSAKRTDPPPGLGRPVEITPGHRSDEHWAELFADLRAMQSALFQIQMRAGRISGVDAAAIATHALEAVKNGQPFAPGGQILVITGPAGEVTVITDAPARVLIFDGTALREAGDAHQCAGGAVARHIAALGLDTKTTGGSDG